MSNPNFTYYCETCRVKNKYPETDKKLLTCTLCGVFSACNTKEARLLTQFHYTSDEYPEVFLPLEEGDPFTANYFNTTRLKGNELNDSVKKATYQNDIIHDFYKSNRNTAHSPSEVWKLCFDETTPITSVRRSITSLTKSGILLKTEIQDTGIYGKPEYKWRLNK